jgi:acyl-coenzyme A synthetase/AMP-(fatty) acid ligase
VFRSQAEARNPDTPEDEVGLTKVAAYVVLVPNVHPTDQLVLEIKDLVAQRVGS